MSKNPLRIQIKQIPPYSILIRKYNPCILNVENFSSDLHYSWTFFTIQLLFIIKQQNVYKLVMRLSFMKFT